MAGFRNVVVHLYQNVDLGIVRDVVENHLGDLLEFAAAIRRKLQPRLQEDGLLSLAGDGDGECPAHRAHLLRCQAPDVAYQSSLLDGLHVIEVQRRLVLQALRHTDEDFARKR